MKLPDGEHALVEDRKLLEYVLNPAHPIGRHHAALFERLLGIGRANYRLLQEALLAAAATHDAAPGQKSAFGRKYEMRVSVTGPRGTRPVLAVWLVERGVQRPRLITCYVE